MASAKTTSFKLDEKHSRLVLSIGEMTGARTRHQAIRNGLKIAGSVLFYQKLPRGQREKVSLEEYLAMVDGLS